MPRRLIHIDAAKVVASNLIVLHHFTVYGPLAEALDVAAPRLTDWFFDYARMAVLVFLVIGGYFAASSLAPHGYWQRSQPLRGVAQRFVRLVLPLGAALLVTIAGGALTRLWLQADFVPAAPDWLQLVSHATLTYGVTGVEPLSIGIWYVAIDFQLFALMTLLLWGGHRHALWLVALAGLASLFYFNLQPDADNWGPYFFGSYAMGAFAWWGGHSRDLGKWLFVLAVTGAAALVWDFRERIALAWFAAMLLGVARSRLSRERLARLHWSRLQDWIRRGARSSYALFLTHFSVLMLANALWANLGWVSVGALTGVVVGAWAACLLLAMAFERYVERPLSLIRV
jgi:peptidoglycan/LPS O-acetylase OafA/YrhL